MNRAEHWIVVRGIASGIIAGIARTLLAGESLYVPVATMHRVSNCGTSPLELIEVRLGTCLGEDDIVRDDLDGRRAKEGLKPIFNSAIS
jgi:mannose-6-phosphate isomerase-like protein (cupin superfamily)